jgi:methionyl-tRNA synthetase
VEAVLEVGKAVNTYLEEQAPWTALKKGDEQQKAAAAQVGGVDA